MTAAPADGIGPQPMPFAYDLLRTNVDGKPATIVQVRTFYGTFVLWLDDDFSSEFENALRTTRGGLHLPGQNGSRP